MCASSLLLLALFAITEIGLAQISPQRQTHLWSPYHGYPKVSGFSKSGNSRSPHFYAPPNVIYKNPNLPSNSYYPHKKINHWMDPIKFKKPGGSKRAKYTRRPYGGHSTDDRKKNHDSYITKLEHSELPSVYLEPPNVDNSEYNYYAKSKKPSVDYRKKEDSKEAEESPQNHRLPNEEDEDDDDDRPTYVRDHAPERQVDKTDVTTDEDKDTSSENVIGSPETPKDRIEFHIHGHEGPQSYIFGFDTGDGSNRQFRLEERHGDGSVTGQYGYIDARGKLRKVRYKASPTEGYVEKHHETMEQEEEEEKEV